MARETVTVTKIECDECGTEITLETLDNEWLDEYLQENEGWFLVPVGDGLEAADYCNVHCYLSATVATETG